MLLNPRSGLSPSRTMIFFCMYESGKKFREKKISRTSVCLLLFVGLVVISRTFLVLTAVVSVDASVFGLLLELVKLIPLRLYFPWFSNFFFFRLKAFIWPKMFLSCFYCLKCPFLCRFKNEK